MNKTIKDKEIILYLMEKLNGEITKTRLVKLMYLIDFFAKQELGRKISSIIYNYYYYGPYSDEIVKDIEELKSEGVIVETLGETNKGNTYHLYTLHSISRTYSNFVDMDERKIADKVILQFGTIDFNKLIEYVYNTGPIRDNKQGQSGIL